MSSVQPIKPVKPAAAKPTTVKPAKKPAPAQVSPSGEAPLSVERAAPERTAAEVARDVRRRRAQKLVRALTLWVGLPTLLAAFYYGLIAADRYESVATLMVQGSGGAGAQAGLMVREHALSRDALEALETSEAFSQHYQQNGDWFARLGTGAGSEARYASFRSNVDVADGEGGLLELRVRAFSGKAAQRFGRRLMSESREFLESVAPTVQLIVISQPSAPTDATRPRRVYGVLTVFFVALAVYVIGSLLMAAVREHAQF